MVAFPVGTIGYAAYRQSRTSKRNRAESIKAKKKSKVHKAEMTPTGKRGDKRNTKYALSGAGGGALGMMAGPFVGRKASGLTKEQIQARNTEGLFRILAGDEKGGKKALQGGKMKVYYRASKASKWAGVGAGAGGYAVYRQSKGGKENRADSIKAKKEGR
jgi:hypothetical protein